MADSKQTKGSCDSGEVLVVEMFGRGGLIHYAYQLCTALAACGVPVRLITASDYELADQPHSFTVERLFRTWDPRPSGTPARGAFARLARLGRRARRALRYYREWARLVRFVRHHRPAVVQLGDLRFPSDLLPLLLLRRLEAPLVDICHNVAPFDIRAHRTSLTRSSFGYRRVFSAIYACFDSIFVHSSEARREFLALYRVPPNRVHVIPHGNERLFLDLEPGSSAPPEPSVDPQRDGAVVLFFGTLTKYKGIDVLVEAFRRVLDAVPTAHLIVAGFPNPEVDTDALRQRAAELHMDRSVHFRFEYVPAAQVSGLFGHADVVVLPYLAISQSGVLQIAYTFGKPVVATRVGGFPEVVEDGETGLLVPPRDPQALADALIALLRAPERAQRMGARARQLASEKYSWTRVAEQVIQGYPVTVTRTVPSSS